MYLTPIITSILRPTTVMSESMGQLFLDMFSLMTSVGLIFPIRVYLPLKVLWIIPLLPGILTKATVQQQETEPVTITTLP